VNHKKNTLLILTPTFPSCEADSTGTSAQQVMVRTLKKKFPFVQFIILSFEYPFTKTPYRWAGNQVIPFDGRNRGRWKKLGTWLRVWRTMTSIHKANELIGIFSCWHGECALLGKYFAQFHGLKHYNWILGQDAHENNRYVSLIRPRSEELLAISESVADSFYIYHSIKPGLILPNGIDPSQFPYRGILRDIDVLGAGALTPQKQYALWVQVAGSLSERRGSLRAMLCGEGPQAGYLCQLIRDHDWQDHLSLCGEIPHRELLGLMQRCKIFLHPSSFEGFSTACLEALYAGAHVISFTNPSRQPIDHWHVVCTTEEMVELAQSILDDPHTDYSPVFPHSMEDNAATVMQLFKSPESRAAGISRSYGGA
jgi:glycosyltransferase involved in cell wall biosynthesis